MYGEELKNMAFVIGCQPEGAGRSSKRVGDVEGKTVSVIGKVSGRDRHTSLLKRGIRIKKESFEMVYLYEKTNLPCLAFAIPKTVGIAVYRNRIRRQYREAFRKLVISDPNSIKEGNYLIKIHSKQSEKFKAEIVLKEALNELFEEHIT